MLRNRSKSLPELDERQVEASQKVPDSEELISKSIHEGGAFSLMVALGETYFPAFAIACGLGDIVAGLVTTLPLLFGACLQLSTPGLLPKFGSHRRWVILFAALQGFAFIPLIYFAFAGGLTTPLLFFCAILYGTSGMLAGPVWNAWISQIIPSSTHAPFFSRRNRRMQWTHLVGFSVAGVFLHYFEFENKGAVFGSLFTLALVARLTSIFWLAAQPDVEDEDPFKNAVRSPQIGWKHLCVNPPLRRFLTYFLSFQFAVGLAGPFVTPFLFSEMKLSYLEYGILIAAGLVGKISILPMVGQFVKNRGVHSIFKWNGFAIVFIPLFFALFPNFYFLILVQFFAGCAWAAFDLAGLVHFMKLLPVRNRTLFLSYYYFGNAVVISTSSALGGFFIYFFGAKGFFILFIASAVTRLVVQGVLHPREKASLRLVRSK